MIFRYFFEIKRDSIKLGQHQNQSEERIKELEKKNGKELKKIEELEEQVQELKELVVKQIN